jgi:hypothetical protein
MTVHYSVAMILSALLALVAVTAVGTLLIGVSVAYLGLALLTMVVIVALVLATARQEAQ